MAEDTALIVSDEFKRRVKEFKKDFYTKYKKISKEKTPQVDGTGKKIIERRPDGYNYIIESYMRECLDKHFPGWSWEAASPLHFLGSEWVVAQGHLIIVDEHLLAFGLNPPTRKFFGVDSVRIQYKKDSEHVPANIIDVGDNCKQANTAALKYAINRLTHIGDDVYGKRIEEEGAGTEEEIMTRDDASATALQARIFGEFLSKKHIPVSKALQILGVKSLAEIQDYKSAYETVKKELEK